MNTYLKVLGLILLAGVVQSLIEIRVEMTHMRWIYQFEHHEKTCNDAEVCK